MRQPASLKQDETETKKAEKPVKNGDFRPKEAVRVGFEPTVDRSPRRFSRPVRSTAPPSHRVGW